MFIEKLEEVIKEKAEKSFEEDVASLDKLIVGSKVGNVLGYKEGEGLEKLGVKVNEQLKEEYVEQFLEREVERLAREVGEDEEEVYIDEFFSSYNAEDFEYFEDYDFGMDFGSIERNKFERIVDILRGRD